MKVAVIGSRNLLIGIKDMSMYMPPGTTEIVSGGARGIDSCAKEYAISHGITITEFLPEYNKYKKGAPLKRNIKIVKYAGEVLAFWDGKSNVLNLLSIIVDCRTKKYTKKRTLKCPFFCLLSSFFAEEIHGNGSGSAVGRDNRTYIAHSDIFYVGHCLFNFFFYFQRHIKAV